MKRMIKFFLMTYLFTLLLGATSLPDPTRPSNIGNTLSNQPLALTAIFIYPSYRVAIINGVALKPGDHINEYIVTTIDTYTVELTDPQNNRETLHLLTPIKEAAPTEQLKDIKIEK